MSQTYTTLPPSVRKFIAAEAARRGLAHDVKACIRELADELAIEVERTSGEAWSESPPMPPEGDPSYSPAIHGPRSPEHLLELLAEGKASGPGKVYKPGELAAELNAELDADSA